MPQTPRTLRIAAHAKVNLALAVDAAIDAGPAAGMHPIASWMTPVTLTDDVEITPLDPGRPAEHHIRWADGRPVEWPVESDLARRAHRTLEGLVGPLPARIGIAKRIPAGGGLGGGSADAAAVLVGLNAAFGLGLPRDDLARLAATLGSDIPFFIDDPRCPSAPPRPAIVTGLGDHIERLDRQPWPPDHALLLICPPFPCPTGHVYRAFDAGPPVRFRADAARALATAPHLDPAALFNDLAEPAERVEPRLGVLRGRLVAETGAPVHVSGSGSTLFIILPREAAEKHVPRITARHPGTIVYIARPATTPAESARQE